MTQTLDVKDLSVHYGDKQALKSLDFTLNAGEIVGLIGQNGAGKSSLVKALCGRVPFSSGKISVSGQPLKSRDARNHLIGLVPQDIGLYGHMTAFENLWTFASIFGVPARDAKNRATEALDVLHLADKTHERVENLSGGMKRRLNVACACLHRPPILILDEPTAGVDIPARDSLHDLVRRLAESGLGILLVTHELEQAEQLCDKVLLLNNGRQLAFESPGALLSRTFGKAREVIIQLTEAPNGETETTLKKFGFERFNHPTQWRAMTYLTEQNFVKNFMTHLSGGGYSIREIAVRRPGLASLMLHLETRATAS